jgi:hypothetical protein
VNTSRESEQFFELDGRPWRRGPVVSGGGLKLHVDATAHSVRSGTPGVVSDDFIRGRRAGTVLEAEELCVTGLWTRAAGGYLVLDDEFVDQVSGIQKMSEKKEWRRRHRRSAQIVPLVTRVLCSI